MISPEEQETGETTSPPHVVHTKAENYEVLARRHRPQAFEDLVGQEAPARALQNAIRSHRVGHAYLFTGARGVGKTSTARIFSKALNCETASLAHDGHPCQTCDRCISIANGRDIDVIEIDGASNRGIDEIRQLRSTVNVRPSRSPYKIYIIDEVHMLTTQAFNALLKTLEEPPAHVKFIFCTTDPEKIPITVLSRCQRFDFSTVATPSIAAKLRDIVDRDGSVDADDEALKLIARRARGSVRDSQSLLEQVLAFCEGKITKDDVHALLGTAQGGSLVSLLDRLANADPAGAIQTLDQAIASGVDPGQLAEQLLGIIRDTLAYTVGCPVEMGQHSDESDFAPLQEIGNKTGVSSLLGMSQVIDQSLTRMRHSTQPRVILELALVRAAQLSQLSQLPQLLQQSGAGSAKLDTLPAPSNSQTASPPSGANTASGAPAAGVAEDERAAELGSPPRPTVAQETENNLGKSEAVRARESTEAGSKKNEKNDSPSPEGQSSEISPSSFDEQTARRIWSQAVTMFEDTTADLIAGYQRVATDGPNSLVVTLKSAYNKELCDRPERKSRIEAVVAEVAKRRLAVHFVAAKTPPPKREGKGPSRSNFHQLRRELEKHPFVVQAAEVLDAEVEDIQFARRPKPS